MYKNITMIAAVSNNSAIGIEGNKLPWNLPKELQLFKGITAGGVIIMGRKTFESFGSKTLPDREHIIVSSKLQKGQGDFHVQRNLLDALNFASKFELPIFLIGGQRIFTEGMQYANKLHITEVDTNVENPTASFPPINKELWKKVSIVPFQPDENNLLPYNFVTFIKRERAK